jgi:hypothetical protein
MRLAMEGQCVSEDISRRRRPGGSAKARDLAEWLLAFEIASEDLSNPNTPATIQVCEKLRRPLCRLVGAAGFHSLFSRALTLAKREAPTFDRMQIKEDGSLEGFNGELTEASAVIIANLLGLLATFIGENLTLHLLHEVWPELPESCFSSEEEEST